MSKEQSSDPWTPGPWETDGRDVGVVGKDWCVGYPPTPGTIASLEDGEYIENENYAADARLIAASPDMIALIRKMRKSMACLTQQLADECDNNKGFMNTEQTQAWDKGTRLITEADALEAKIMGDSALAQEQDQ